MSPIKSWLTVVAIVAIIQSSALADGKSIAAKDWPAWRGPLATGEAPNSNPPITWSEQKNIKWKVAIPGRGHATPIIWGDRIYIQTAVEGEKAAEDAAPEDAPFSLHDSAIGHDALQPDGPPDRPRRPGGRRGGRGRRPPPSTPFAFKVLALDRQSGKTIWTTTVNEATPHEGGHPDASQASNSPVTDGEHIYAYFGSRGLHCLTKDGKIKWSKDFGQMRTANEFGEGSSPALYKDMLIINWDHEGDDFIAALDKKSGKELWRVERDERTTWSTPLVIEAKSGPQVIAPATGATRAYDLKTGKEIWRCSGMTGNVIPSPMVFGDLVFAISGFRGAALQAIRYDRAKGDITDSDVIAWKYNRDTPYVPSALLYNARLYFIDNTRPLITCLDAKTGKPVFEKTRLEGIDGVYASLVGAGGHVYIAGRNGATIVLKDGTEFEMIAKNELDEGFDASPAIVGDELFLRGRSSLYCIAEQ